MAVKPGGRNTTVNIRKLAERIESWRLEGAQHYCLAVNVFWAKEKVRVWHRRKAGRKIQIGHKVGEAGRA